jgi:hypothetical protein
MLDLLDQIVGWLFGPLNWRKTNGPAFVLYIVFSLLFGTLLTAACWHSLWQSDWAVQRIELLLGLIVGLLLISQAIGSLASFTFGRKEKA